MRANEDGRWDADLPKWHLWRSDLPVVLHVKDRTVIVTAPYVRVFSALHVENRVFVAAAGRIILQKDGQSVHIVDLVVASGHSVEQVATEITEMTAKGLYGRLFHPVEVEKIVCAEFVGQVLKFGPFGGE